MASKHKHHYIVVRTTTGKIDGQKVTYIFKKCDAPGPCNEPDKMDIRRR